MDMTSEFASGAAGLRNKAGRDRNEVNFSTLCAGYID